MKKGLSWLLLMLLSTAALQAQDDKKNDDKYKVNTHNDFVLNLGLNNYLQGSEFPDATGEQYTLRPFNSWVVGIGSIYKTRFSRSFYVEWGGDVSLNNYRFDDAQTLIVRSATGISFETDNRTDIKFLKSKLTAGFVNASFIPMVRLGGSGKSLRIGAGLYAGYRVTSVARNIYRVDENILRNRTPANYYLENVHYGVKARLGFRDMDFFATYELNPLFTPGRGPELNVVSVGVSLMD